MKETKEGQQAKIDAAVALAMWNAGSSAGVIARHFDVTTSAARWAVLKAAREAERRLGKYKPEPAVPALAALWLEGTA